MSELIRFGAKKILDREISYFEKYKAHFPYLLKFLEYVNNKTGIIWICPNICEDFIYTEIDDDQLCRGICTCCGSPQRKIILSKLIAKISML